MGGKRQGDVKKGDGGNVRGDARHKQKKNGGLFGRGDRQNDVGTLTKEEKRGHKEEQRKRQGGKKFSRATSGGGGVGGGQVQLLLTDLGIGLRSLMGGVGSAITVLEVTTPGRGKTINMGGKFPESLKGRTEGDPGGNLKSRNGH